MDFNFFEIEQLIGFEKEEMDKSMRLIETYNLYADNGKVEIEK
ncbi:hypothetical protein [Bacillus sp. M6-12]|nr:hypothetical protein [Bacillus sp. M6-12]